MAGKLGLASVAPELIGDLLQLMVASKADYTIVFRELASLPTEITPLKRGFYVPCDAELEAQWNAWLTRWHQQLSGSGEPEEIAAAMRRTNPATTWREWLIAPAYEQAAHGDYSLVHNCRRCSATPTNRSQPNSLLATTNCDHGSSSAPGGSPTTAARRRASGAQAKRVGMEIKS